EQEHAQDTGRDGAERHACATFSWSETPTGQFEDRTSELVGRGPQRMPAGVFGVAMLTETMYRACDRDVTTWYQGVAREVSPCDQYGSCAASTYSRDPRGTRWRRRRSRHLSQS